MNWETIKIPWWKRLWWWIVWNLKGRKRPMEGAIHDPLYDPTAPPGYQWACPRCKLHMGHTLECVSRRDDGK